MKNLVSFLAYLLLVAPFQIGAQQVPLEEEWLKERANDFTSPLPIPLELAGNFGECRPNHFHTGLDFKTNQQENIRVNAVADGYVSRISMSHTGYGHCLYVTHNNGLTSVYAHLNTFAPEIERYLIQEQNKQEQWSIHLQVPEGLLLVKQGEMIALSGNTGGSMAPHLHFEIRKTGTNLSINPLHFQAFQVKDQIAPQLIEVGIYNAEKSLFQQHPIYLTPQKKGKDYFLQANVPFQQVYLSFHAKDFMNNSQNWLGIYQFQIYQEEHLLFETKINAIDLTINRMMNAYIDYPKYRKSNNMFQLAHLLPNNQLALYPTNINQGVLSIDHFQNSEIKVVISDFFNNSTTLYLHLTSSSDSIRETIEKDTSFVILSPKKDTKIEEDFYWLSTSYNSFYDTVYLSVKEQKTFHSYSKTYQISTPLIPIHEGVTLGLRLTQPIPLELRSKLVFLNEVKGSELPGRATQTAIPAQYDKGYAVAEINNFGQFEVAIDTIAPIIKLSSSSHLKKGQLLIVEVKENLTYLSDFRAYDENGQWMNMRRVKNQFYFTIPEHWNAGSHLIQIFAADANQNIQQQNFTLNILSS